MPITALRIQAYQLLALAIKADEEGRSALMTQSGLGPGLRWRYLLPQ